MKLNRTELAELLGITLPSIDLRVRKGMPYECKGGRGKAWVFNATACIEWEKQQAIDEVIGDTTNADIEELKRRKLAAETMIAEIEAAKCRQEVALLDEIEQVWANAMIELRGRLRIIPSRVAPLLIGKIDESQIKEIILNEIDQSLTLLSEHSAG